jgi:hypothetical protein
MYSRDLSRKIRSAIRQRFMHGLWFSGQKPYGYKKDPDNKNRIVPDEEAAENIIEIFRLALEGKGIVALKEIGVSGSIVRYWQRETKQVSLPNLLKLADCFGCTMDFLAGRSGNEMAFVPQTPPPFPQAFRRALAARGITRYKLTWNTKFSDNCIYSWDRGSQPDLSAFVELADLLKGAIDYLVGREN